MYLASLPSRASGQCPLWASRRIHPTIRVHVPVVPSLSSPSPSPSTLPVPENHHPLVPVTSASAPVVRRTPRSSTVGAGGESEDEADEDFG